MHARNKLHLIITIIICKAGIIVKAADAIILKRRCVRVGQQQKMHDLR